MNKAKWLISNMLVCVMLIGFTTSCNDDMSEINGNNEAPGESKGSYLTFASQEDFNRLMEQLHATEEDESVDNSSLIKTYSSNGNFISLKEKLERIKKKEIRTYSDDDCEEVTGITEEEFFFQLMVDSLIYESALESVLNENLMIGIAQKVYRVTPYGTFVIDANKESLLDGYIASFNKDNVSLISDGLYKVADGVEIQDTYGEISGDKYILEAGVVVEEDILDEVYDIDAEDLETYGFENPADNTKTFNLNTYAWKNKTFFGKVFSKIFGKDATRNVKFDSNHRVACELYQVNYRFYQSTGFKVWLQKRKKFLGIKYWKKDSSGVQDLAVGIEYIKGEMNVNLQFNSIPTFGTFTSTIAGQVHEVIYNGFNHLPFTADWAAKAYTFATKKELKADVSKKLAKEITNKTFSGVGKRLTLTDPKVIYNNFRNGKIDSELTGLQYYKSSSKSIRFSQSGGITIMFTGNGSVSAKPWIPERYTLKKVSIFGAMKYKNQWKGVRFEWKMD